jgi:hypothetical protein
MQKRISVASLSFAAVLVASVADAQFRRGIFSESTEVTLYPLGLPAMLLPPGNVQVDVRNASAASARIVEKLNELIGRQLSDNDSRLSVVDKGADIFVSVTLIDWRESRRDSTKYVSEKRQVGTRRVRKKDGSYENEPIYEYGRNRPSVVIDASAGLRVEVKRGRSTTMADETVRHTIHEEHLLDEGPPSRDVIEDTLIDKVVEKGAARISPGRITTRVLLARSDEVDRLNGMAQNRRWHDWLEALSGLKAHSDRKKDSYRVHNIAVAQEAIAYEATDTEDWVARLNLATVLINQSLAQNPKEKYIEESAERIKASAARYRQLSDMYQLAKQSAPPAASPRRTPAPASSAPASAAPSKTSPVIVERGPDQAVMTNQDVIDLRTSGLDDDNLIAAINDAKMVGFDLSPAGLKSLLGAKVSNRVIAAMRNRAK